VIVNFLGSTGVAGVSGSTGSLSGMSRNPSDGDDWTDPISGDRFIFTGGLWRQVPCCNNQRIVQLETEVNNLTILVNDIMARLAAAGIP